jgi:hypothetical protein
MHHCMRQMRLTDRTVEAGVGAAIRKLAAPITLAAVLPIAIDRLGSRLLLQGFNQGVVFAVGLGGNVRVVRNNEPQVVPCIGANVVTPSATFPPPAQ